MTGSSSTPETAAASEPYELPPRSTIAAALVGVTFHDRVRIQPSDADILAAGVLDALAAAGFTVVSGGEGLQHGARLECDGWRIANGKLAGVYYGGERRVHDDDVPVYRVASGAAPGTTAEPGPPDLADPYEPWCSPCGNRHYGDCTPAAGATAPETTPAACVECGRPVEPLEMWQQVVEGGAGLARGHRECIEREWGSGVAETTP